MKKITNLKKYEAAFRLALGLTLTGLATNPMVVYADEVVYEVTEENQEDNDEVVEVEAGTSVIENTPAPEITQDDNSNKNDNMTSMPEGTHEYGENEFIDASNWSQEHDAEPNAGEHIPDTVQTELERKNGTPNTPDTPDTPDKPHTPDTPSTPTPTTPPTTPPIPKTDGFDSKFYLLCFLVPSILSAGYGIIKGIRKANNELIELDEAEKVVKSKKIGTKTKKR